MALERKVEALEAKEAQVVRARAIMHGTAAVVPARSAPVNAAQERSATSAATKQLAQGVDTAVLTRDTKLWMEDFKNDFPDEKIFLSLVAPVMSEDQVTRLLNWKIQDVKEMTKEEEHAWKRKITSCRQWVKNYKNNRDKVKTRINKWNQEGRKESVEVVVEELTEIIDQSATPGANAATNAPIVQQTRKHVQLDANIEEVDEEICPAPPNSKVGSPVY